MTTETGASPYTIGNYLDGSLSTAGDLKRFTGIPTFLKAPLLESVRNPTLGIVGVPFDGGTVRTPGSRFGPRAIRNTSWRLNEFNGELGVNPYALHRIVDCGDIILSTISLTDASRAIEAGITELIRRGIIPMAIGGDHYVTLPILRAVAAKHGPVAIVQFDSHTDTADEGFGQKHNHGTMFRRAVEEGLVKPDQFIQIGIRKLFFDAELEFHAEHGIEIITSRDMKMMGPGLRGALKKRLERLQGQKVYVTFDIDFVDPTYAPATGSPEVAGPTSDESLEAVRALQGLDIVGFDLTEVSPQYDFRDLTALLAVQVLYEMASVLKPTIGRS
jgi:agmatinase